MWLSDVSVKRPVLATVLNALLLVFGLYALFSLSVREYPDIDPPVVSVSTGYPGASAPVVENRITQVLEEQIAGIEGIRSLNSVSRDGRSNITIEFSLTRNIDDAANDVRDRVSRVLNNLPDEVDPPEVTKADSDASPIIWTVLSSDRMSAMDLSTWAEGHIVDRFAALDGVSAVRIGGDRKPAMRIWLDRRQLAARNLTVQDVEQALSAQNVERPAGKLESAEREFSLRTARAFNTPEEFAQLVIARGANGYAVTLGDVGRVEVAPENLQSLFRANGKPAIGIGVIKQSTANTLSVARAVKAEMARIAEALPPGMDLRVNSDFSLFIEASLREVMLTLGIAALLVVLVIFIFLGDWRATLIPAASVPISLVASFLFLLGFGFSINILTLLALVLAIGLVVDDTIVVVENIHRRIHAGETPLVASYRGTREVGFAIVATTAVLIAVFTPLAFLEGNIGRLFSEFALALAGSVFCSAVVSLTLSPVLCSMLLRAVDGGSSLAIGVDRAMSSMGERYRQRLGGFIDRPRRPALLLAILVAGTLALFAFLPAEFTPREDRGQFQVQATGPEGASFDYTVRQLGVVENSLLERLRGPAHPDSEIDRFLLRIPGFGGSSGINTGAAMVSLVDWSERERSTDEVAGELGRELAKVPGINARTVQRSGFGTGYGQPLQVAIGGGSWEELAEWRNRLLARIARENPRILRPDTDYKETKPTLDIAIDLQRAADLGVSVESVSHTLETLLAGRHTTNWLSGGEEYDVILQAAPGDRATPADINGIYVRSATSGALVPLGNLLTTREVASADTLNRYNRLRTVTFSAGLAPGYTLGEAVAYMEKIIAEELPASARVSWKGDARELKEAGGAIYLTFAVALLVVFLVLAAQFESWVHPLAIMTTVPLAVFGGLAALAAFGYSLNIYSQIGLVMLIGLAAKNGILIVEFANQRRDAGDEFRTAILDAARIRLRPILMTSLATAAGAIPLIVGSGAGSEARANLGVVVFWGVLFSTFLTLVVVPAFYSLLCRHTGSPGARAVRLEQESQPRG
ncbi:MAG: efflux RND transporter permease subunit [Pseudomonadota bacterium]